MHSFRAFLTTVAGLTVTGFAFAVAATFSFAIIGLVVFAALAGIAVAKLAPYVRVGMTRLQPAEQTSRFLRGLQPWRSGQVWNEANGIVVDA